MELRIDSFLNLIASKIAASLLSFRKERRDEIVLLPFTTARTISLERDGDQGQKKKKKKGKGNYFHGESELLDRTDCYDYISQSSYHGSELN